MTDRLKLRTKPLRKLGAVDLNETTEYLAMASGTVSRDSLEIVPYTGDLAEADADSVTAAPPDRLRVTLNKRSKVTADLAVEARTQGAVALSSPLGLTCSAYVGKHGSHLGAGSIDLLASVSNSIDLRKVVAIQQILHNKTTCIFDQLAGPYGSPSVLACGDVAENAGKALFGKVWVTPYLSYHQPLPYQAAKLDWDDLKYTEAVTKKAVAAIKSHLDNGTAPRVGFVHHVTPGMVAKNGALQPTLTGGHFGLIVAYSEDRFLYLDPYPQASKTTYAGGLPFNKGKVCSYLGVLHLSTTRGLHMETIAETSSPGILGEMEVIAGPL